MSTVQLYAIRDAKTEAYMPPYQAVSHGEAIRQFSDVCKNPDTMLNRHPADFALFHIGAFNSESGALVPVTQVLQLSSALEFVAGSSALKAV